MFQGQKGPLCSPTVHIKQVIGLGSINSCSVKFQSLYMYPAMYKLLTNSTDILNRQADLQAGRFSNLEGSMLWLAF